MDNLKHLLIKKEKTAWFGKRVKFTENYKFFSKGFTVTPNSLLENKKISNNDKMILINLLNFAFKGDVCFPSLTTLVMRTGLTKPSIISGIKKLEKLNFIQVDREIGGNNVYVINMSIFNEM